MRRLLPVLFSLALLALPTVAVADGTTLFAGAAAAAPRLHLTGQVLQLGYSTLTIQTDGRRMGRINAMVAEANALTRANYPYVWGGGHAAAGVASAGESGGRGYNGRRRGYDCSGSVAAVLAAAGLWPPGSGVPADNGVISELRQAGLISRGAGRTPNEVTLYDRPGHHIFMSINGRFFGTSDGAGSGSRAGGPGWLSDGAPDASSSAFKQYHFNPAILRDKVSYGHDYTFETGFDPSILNGLQPGDKVIVGYANAGSGRMVARTITFAGAVTVSGLMSDVAPDRMSFSLLTPAGRTLTFSPGRLGALPSADALGETLQVTYTTTTGTLNARVVTSLAPPVLVQATGTAQAVTHTAVTLKTSTGQTLTLAVPASVTLPADLVAGRAVGVSYVVVGKSLFLSSLSETS